ncbi:MAG: ABC transporter substrate-binding protein [Thermoprotei archaeon ex4572_64]|nr:MAG: ABC transporter substrate-binding protein [Thermoprotei archaeon ex4572_64]
MSRKFVTIGHTPDPDDAFMFYALRSRIVKYDFDMIEVILDIETLNKLSMKNLLDFTAISVYTYGHVFKNYYLVKYGASFGINYGPIVVSRKEKINNPKDTLFATPGEYTTSTLLLKLYFGKDIDTVVLPFSEIPKLVAMGIIDAGVLIHEAQLTYRDYGLNKVIDLGEWWYSETKLPLPLGVNVVSKRLSKEFTKKLVQTFKESITYALKHEDEALRYALNYSRDKEIDRVRKFVKMYVNELSIDMGNLGLKAIDKLLSIAYQEKLLSEKPEIEVLD